MRLGGLLTRRRRIMFADKSFPFEFPQIVIQKLKSIVSSYKFFAGNVHFTKCIRELYNQKWKWLRHVTEEKISIKGRI